MAKKRLCIILAAVWGLLIPVSALCATLDEPITLTCWTYYNGVQAQTMERMLQKFNDTVGLEKGIFVEMQSFGGVNDLAAQVIASARKEAGAEPLPDLFAAYADTGYQLLQMGVVSDISAYLTPDEQNQYIDAYIDEGRIGSETGLYIFPVAKSTELLLLNRTAWDEFAAATGADENLLDTWEGIVALSKAYFEWTDAKTADRAGDGDAFFGRDAMANFMLMGSLQLGEEIFQVKDGVAELHFDRQVMRRLWDHFYVPFASGWFAASGKFRSDDIKTGQIIALVGSTSGASYFPSQVTFDDGTAHDIECSVRLLPNFEGTQPVAPQQGAGFMVGASTPERERAAVEFLKWFTQPENNISFSLTSGYLPVTKQAHSHDALQACMREQEAGDLIRAVIGAGAQIVTTYRLYTNDPFLGGVEARAVLEDTLLAAAKAAQAERLSLQAQGVSYEDAVAAVTGGERFDQWYESTLAALQEALAVN